MKIKNIMDNQRFTNILLSIVAALMSILIWWVKTAYSSQIEYNENRDKEMVEINKEVIIMDYRVNRLFDIHKIPRE